MTKLIMKYINRTTRVLSGILSLLPACGLLSACQDENIGGEVPDMETLIEQGRYVTARNGESTAALEDLSHTALFPVGTPYRLLAFTKPYDPNRPGDDTPGSYLRFNTVAWEDSIPGGLRSINVESSPETMFGFSPICSEPAGTDGRVSLDFYGLTYGEAVENRTADYVALTGDNLENFARTENVDRSTYELKDLMWGRLLNRNISTVSGSTLGAQNVLEFRHCFSRLRFLVAQQEPDDNPDALRFENVYVDDVKVTGVYLEGSVSLKDGKVTTTGDTGTQTLNITKKDYVTTIQAEIGKMIVYPTDASSLAQTDVSRPVGIEVKLKSPNKDTIDKLLANAADGSGEAQLDTDGLYYGVIREASLYNSYDKIPLYLKQNTTYTLVISLQDASVRIITVIPNVAEWIPGEWTGDSPWQQQSIGQPQMFDNIVWSDRNLGAEDYNLANGFEKTIGYFYQTGRNIPYYPFNTEDYFDDSHNPTGSPKLSDRYSTNLADVQKAALSTFRLYPIVDERILNMSEGSYNSYPHSDGTWSMTPGDDGSVNAQMTIPESKPTNMFFNFVRPKSEDATKGLPADADMHWENGPDNQPVSGAWKIPTSEQFMSIFPTTPFAGNITFRSGGNSWNPLNWAGWGSDMDESVKTLRLTVPFYSCDPDTKEPDCAPLYPGNADYMTAWNLLVANKDIGSTKLDKYTYDNYSPDKFRSTEPIGDPVPRYASVYVLSRDGNDLTTLEPELPWDKFSIRSWGVIYGIKRVYTDKAYRIRWRVLYGLYGSGTNIKDKTPGMVVEICRYRCKSTDHLNEDNYKSYDWEHPAAKIYFPICGFGDWTGQYINFGTECDYSTSDPIKNSKSSSVHLKITGDTPHNSYIAVIKDIMNRNIAKQIRPVSASSH